MTDDFFYRHPISLGERVTSIQVTQKESDLNLKSTKDRRPLWSPPVFCYAAPEATNNCLGNNIALIEVFLCPKKKTEMASVVEGGVKEADKEGKVKKIHENSQWQLC